MGGGKPAVGEDNPQMELNSPWHTLSIQEVIKAMDLNENLEKSGLTTADAAARLEKYGPNKLTEKVKKTLLQRIWHHINNILVYVLLTVAVVSLIQAVTTPDGQTRFTAWFQVALILSVITLNTWIGIYQEGNAEKAADALKNMLSSDARVIRDSKEIMVAASDLVPGDVCLLGLGDKVPADLRQITSLNSAMDTVKQLEEKLTKFAQTHHKAIATDPAFRQKFLSMCAPLGVDPLTSKKSFWSFLNMGDFYHELAVKVAEVCYAYRSRNGGIMSIKEVQSVLKRRGTKFRLNEMVSQYNEQDIIVAIDKLKQLGSGFRTVKVGNSMMVVSVPTELDNDHVHVIQLAQDVAQGITAGMVKDMTGWDEDRVMRSLNLLLTEGMAWIDHFNEQDYYWFPSVWKDSLTGGEM